MDEVADHDLLAACIAGDRRAWQTLVERFSRYIHAMIRLSARRCGVELDAGEADDLHHDVFVSLLEDDRRRLRAFRGENGCTVRSWLRIIAIRRTIDALRKRRPHLSLEALNEQGAPPPVESAPDPLARMLEAAESDAGDASARIAAIAAEIAPADRLMLELLYVQKLPIEAVAAALRTTRGALYTRKSRLVARLRAKAEAARAES